MTLWKRVGLEQSVSETVGLENRVHSVHTLPEPPPPEVHCVGVSSKSIPFLPPSNFVGKEQLNNTIPTSRDAVKHELKNIHENVLKCLQEMNKDSTPGSFAQEVWEEEATRWILRLDEMELGRDPELTCFRKG